MSIQPFLFAFALRKGSFIIIFNLCEDEVITTNNACSELEYKEAYKTTSLREI
jgi:hypothetical protein